MPPDQTSGFRSCDSYAEWTNRLRPISPQRLRPPKPPETSSTEQPLDERLLPGRLRPTWTQASRRQPLREKLRTNSPRPHLILDWDLESRAIGFADPEWVPQEVTAIAWSWIGDEHVSYATLLDGQDYMFGSFLDAFKQADVITGHNMIRFDLPVIQADLLRCGFPKLTPVKVQDTIRIIKTKGFKKGQDNLSVLLHNPVMKQELNWQEWHDAYKESDWRTIIDRVTSDVRQHKILRARMLELGWLREAVLWSP